jgi:hypothetical protein
VLNPAWFWKNLLVFLLIHTDDLSTVIKNNKPIASGALIKGPNIIGHIMTSFLKASSFLNASSLLW